MTKHKHADLIHAWADGAVIQHRMPNNDHWFDVFCNEPEWHEHHEYRIKPEEKKPVVRWLWAWDDGLVTSRLMTEEEVTGMRSPPEVKLEWSRTEFPE